MSPIFLDSETCGLCGPMVLLQWAEGDGEIHLWSVWKEKVGDTLDLLEKIVLHSGGVVGFNMAFDWFQIQKVYTMFSLVPKDWVPEDHIEELALLESEARDGPCLKPQKVCDLMLIAKRHKYQSTMNRKSIVIRRVPNVIAQDLADLLESNIEINEIYFSRKKKQSKKWSVRDSIDKKGFTDPDFKNIVLSFRASAALKVIANDLLGKDRYGRKRFLYSDIELHKKWTSGEVGFAPFATAISSPESKWRISKQFFVKNMRGKYTWPAVIKRHIDHWAYSTPAREYAADDVKDTRSVYYALDSPELGDIDSTLACMVASCRWRGYTVDLEGVKEQRAKMLEVMKTAPRSPAEAKAFISALMSPLEAIGFTTTKKMVLTKMVRQMKADCPDCDGTGNLTESNKLVKVAFNGGPLFEATFEARDMEIDYECKNCKGSGEVIHPAAIRAQKVLDSRAAKKEIETYDKLLCAGRFHASFSVIGTLSGRMAGADRFNPQAIKNSGNTKSFFTLAQPGYILCGGDFEGFEVAIAEARYNDPKLREALLSTTECFKCHGEDKNCEDCHGTNVAKMKVHAMFGTFLYPNMTYAEIVKDKVIYTRSKSGFFLKIYGGNVFTMMERLDIEEQAAISADQRFEATFLGVKKARLELENMFQSMRQPRGIGTKVEWHTPVDFIANMLNPPFCRYFTLENAICKALFDISNKPPKQWEKYRQLKVWRKDRQQTVPGSVQSALYGAAFQIQSSNKRAGGNHEIQSTGAEINKDLQFNLWKLQPCGINEFLVQPMNVHDELQMPVKNNPTLIESVDKIVEEIIQKYKPLIPLIEINWKSGLGSWAEK